MHKVESQKFGCLRSRRMLPPEKTEKRREEDALIHVENKPPGEIIPRC
jgi:hypothetical protein